MCHGNGQSLYSPGSKILSGNLLLKWHFFGWQTPMEPINRNLESRLWTLMAKKLAGETSQDELIELEGLVQKIPNAHYVLEILTFWWEISERSGKEQAEQAVADLLSQLEKENEMFPPKKKGRIDNLCLA